ncbi:hypothetical protein NITLEN_30056 [Nitrospira lenta]|uniref:Uncharacterized protein n=1 Tax=Nitrospira lenta TaxID=1436998 RepID=A0A330L5N2_9BACT|nr:hypothetical protein NITLEN_30056 [Nitrospira lenta]
MARSQSITPGDALRYSTQASSQVFYQAHR